METNTVRGLVEKGAVPSSSFLGGKHVGHSFFLAASLALGQGQVYEVEVTAPPRYQRQVTSVQHQTRTWTSSPSTGWVEDRPFFERVGNRIGQIMGRRPAGGQQPQTQEPQWEDAQGQPLGQWRQVTPDGRIVIDPHTEPAPIQPRELPRRVTVTPSGVVTIETVEPPLYHEALKPASYGQTNPVEPIQSPDPVLVPWPEDALPLLPSAPAPTTPATSAAPAPSAPLLTQAKLGQPTPQSGDLGPIHARLLSRLGHEQDWSRIIAQLQIENGAYVLYYAAPGVADRFGGRIVLYPEIDMVRFRQGDLVNVRGHVLQQPGRAPLYVGQSIELIER